jgi:hypothetical protein
VIGAATQAAVFTPGTLVRKRIEKRRHQEKDVRVHNRLSALLWLAFNEITKPDTAALLEMLEEGRP